VTLAFLLCWTDPQVILPLYPAVEDVVADEHVPADHVGHLVPVLRVHAHTCTVHTSSKAGVLKNTDKKENQIFLINKEFQSGAVAKSYMRKGFLMYEEMRKYFPIRVYEEAVSHILYEFATAPFGIYHLFTLGTLSVCV
jgi:hypothetical protein